MAPQPKISPSMLSSDFACLADEAKRMVGCGADCLHMDIMDGHFVPNLTMGHPVIKSLRKHTDAFLDCHMMVSNPEQWVEEFAKAGASMYCFHYEATSDPGALIDKIKASGMKAGLAIKPKTAVEVVFPFAEKLDQVLVMTVEPGFGGQKFMHDCIPKVRTLRSKYPNLDIQVDGGVGPDNIDLATEAGANVIVAGTSVFGAPEPREAIRVLRESVLVNVTNK
ncbi:Ribulose-phosphate 3-epimerase-like protein [Fimicolochytrium jonesii]|uniref:Ribulose-phosphate 3-epimerase-like protein n=1 Tax=Fimicolochytrium jonesii TaxID=1396493 RepID=UPI0022FEE3D2|nr:Ribulose-phosphate 3-epimerase-like protein [Fimicolochytrium jonesii]KAI8821822.1 Ribulose-phosphate 3-epimerase-like protein [Fimicolochytrium jonesii]